MSELNALIESSDSLKEAMAEYRKAYTEYMGVCIPDDKTLLYVALKEMTRNINRHMGVNVDA